MVYDRGRRTVGIGITGRTDAERPRSRLLRTLREPDGSRDISPLSILHDPLVPPSRLRTPSALSALTAPTTSERGTPSASLMELMDALLSRTIMLRTRSVTHPDDDGDMGIVTGICRNQEESRLYVDFGDGRTMEYAQNELDALDLAYATTVHKSQGSEYDTVILSLQTAHYIMLRRPLLYTAITRAKRHVIIVGERKALVIAIGRADAEKRGTMLAERINEAKAAGV